MVIAQSDSPIPLDDLDAAFDETEARLTEPAPASKKRARRFSLRLPPRVQLALGVLGGILIGWFVFGWWLWPVDWQNSTPWQMSPAYQKKYVALVAERFWQTSDVAQMQSDLAGWKRDDLLRLIEQMQRETSDPQARQRIAILSDALRMPTTETSLVSVLLNSQIVLIGLALSVIPLFVAMALLAAPYLKRKPVAAEEIAAQEGALAEGNLEELLADVQLEATAAAQEAQKKKEEEEKKEEEKKQEESEEQANSLGDLASLFEEEDTSLSALEQFCKGMPDIPADQLLDTTINTWKKLREANSQRRKKK